MKLEIITLEKVFYRDEVELVGLPGVNGYFTVLRNHAPMIATLCAGPLRFKEGKKEISVRISAGFVRIKANVVSVCVENVEMEDKR